jgi:hypothetical protein
VLFVGIAKKFWFRRNTVVHGGAFLHLNSIAKVRIASVEEYKNVNLPKIVSPTENISGIHTNAPFVST